MKLTKKNKVKVSIPTTAMPDIIFMLIFFFMVSSVLRESDGLPIEMPEAKQIQKLESRNHVKTIWVAKTGMISIDDKLVNVKSIRNIIYLKRKADPQLIISLRADRKVKMEVIEGVHQELRKADALKVNYSTKKAT